MTQEEKNELMDRLGPQDYEAYMELRRQMDVLAADERMDDAQKAAFYAQIREELIVMRKQRDLLTRRLQAFNDLIDEVETRLKETENTTAERKRSCGFCRRRRPTRRLTTAKSRRRTSRRA